MASWTSWWRGEIQQRAAGEEETDSDSEGRVTDDDSEADGTISGVNDAESSLAAEETGNEDATESGSLAAAKSLSMNSLNISDKAYAKELSRWFDNADELATRPRKPPGIDRRNKGFLQQRQAAYDIALKVYNETRARWADSKKSRGSERDAQRDWKSNRRENDKRKTFEYLTATIKKYRENIETDWKQEKKERSIC